jgi:Na+/H+-dicarboxylate symporter
LNGIASVIGFTYNEINIIVYYILLPFVYVALVDRLFKQHSFKIAYVVGWVVLIFLIKDFSAFSDALFKYSVDFLLLFGHLGLNYTAASVVICVVLPALVFVLLSLLAFPSLRRRFLPQHRQPASA